MTTVRYFLPEDGDTETHPNVYLAPKPTKPGYPPLLGQVKETFPLPGRYHFRFKSPLVPGTDRDKGSVAVWMDCVDDSQPVGVWQNAIIAKVTRLGTEEEFDDDDDEFAQRESLSEAEAQAAAAAYSNTATPSASVHSSAHSTPRPSPPPSAAASSDSLLGVFDDDHAPAAAPAAAAAAASNPPSTHSSTGNLLDVGGHASPAPAPASGGSLLDMDGPVYSHGGGPGASQPTASSSHDDLLGMSAPAPQQAQPAGGAASGHMPQYAPHQPQVAMQQQHAQAQAQAQAQAYGQQQMPVPPQNRQPPSRTSSNVSSGGSNAFENFSSQQGPFGGLAWK